MLGLSDEILAEHILKVTCPSFAGRPEASLALFSDKIDLLEKAFEPASR